MQDMAIALAAVLLSCVPLTSMPAAALAACPALDLSGPGAAFGAAPRAPLVLRERGGMAEAPADAAADAAADAMADELADAAADDEMVTGEEEEEGERSANPLRDLIDEGCAAWDEDDDAERAESAFQQALALDPTSPDALCSMGVLMHESGRDLKAAAAYFAKSIESSPVRILQSTLHVNFYVCSKCTRALTFENLWQEHVDSLHYYGNLLHAQHDDSAAELMYKRAVQVIEDAGIEEPEDVHPLYVDTLCNHGALLERVRHDIDGAQVEGQKRPSIEAKEA